MFGVGCVVRRWVFRCANSCSSGVSDVRVYPPCLRVLISVLFVLALFAFNISTRVVIGRKEKLVGSSGIECSPVHAIYLGNVRVVTPAFWCRPRTEGRASMEVPRGLSFSKAGNDC